MGSTKVLAAAALSLCAVVATPAAAQSDTSVEQRLKALETLVTTQAAQIQAQRRTLDLQAEQLAKQNEALQTLKQDALEEVRGRGAAAEDVQVAPVAPGPSSVAASAEQPSGPVGEAPAETREVVVAALPENTGVLTPKGHGVIEPAFRYVHGSTNRLVFRGVEIVTGVQIGVIEASDADRSTLSPSIAARYGLTDRLEVEVVAPYVKRSDRVTTLAQRDQTVSRTLSLDGADIGDVELGARYQLNRARPGRPVYIASLRYKSDTGTSPFDIDRDEFGVATKLATGSGFKGGTAGLSFLYPTDPAVIFGSVSYLYNAPKDIDRTIGDVVVGRVNPGDAISLSAGFGFALNPQFSFSLGYSQTYVDKTVSYLNATRQEAESLQIGALMFGWSLRLTPRLTLSNSYEFGATSDAPDVSVVFRLPYRF
jgi:hypothetical protein